MNLREQLAKRLEDVGRARYFMTNENAPAPSGLSLDLADECIRQMEWNARNAFDSCCNRGMLSQDLTIAPDDWKPE